MTIKYYYIKDAANIAVEASANLDEDNCMENEMADKLDILMEILFKYIHEVTHINGKCQELFLTAEIIKNDEFQLYCQYILKQTGKIS